MTSQSPETLAQCIPVTKKDVEQRIPLFRMHTDAKDFQAADPNVDPDDTQ